MNSDGDENSIQQTRRKFVVLRHDPGPKFTRQQQTHWDWMFEKPDGMLRTFATDCLESLDERVNLLAESLADHRHAYLDYEGPISNDRGTVRRVIRGVYQLCFASPHRWEALLFWKHPDSDNDYRTRSLFVFDETREVWHFTLFRER